MREARSDLPEVMDDLAIPSHDLEIALKELHTINRWLGGYRTTRIGVARLTDGSPPDKQLTVLDIGAGGTDLPEILRPLGRPFEVTAVDINPLVRDYSLRHRQTRQVLIRSAHQLDFPDRSFDIVHVSLFLHHCTSEEAEQLLRNSMRIARLGVVINELQRTLFALTGIVLLTALFSRSWIVRNDAPLSVRRGFTRRELETLAFRTGNGELTLSRHWASRWCLSIPSRATTRGS